jgi:hypothetical protein
MEAVIRNVPEHVHNLQARLLKVHFNIILGRFLDISSDLYPKVQEIKICDPVLFPFNLTTCTA